MVRRILSITLVASLVAGEPSMGSLKIEAHVDQEPQLTSQAMSLPLASIRHGALPQRAALDAVRWAGWTAAAMALLQQHHPAGAWCLAFGLLGQPDRKGDSVRVWPLFPYESRPKRESAKPSAQSKSVTFSIQKEVALVGDDDTGVASRVKTIIESAILNQPHLTIPRYGEHLETDWGVRSIQFSFDPQVTLPRIRYTETELARLLTVQLPFDLLGKNTRLASHIGKAVITIRQWQSSRTGNEAFPMQIWMDWFGRNYGPASTRKYLRQLGPTGKQAGNDLAKAFKKGFKALRVHRKKETKIRRLLELIWRDSAQLIGETYSERWGTTNNLKSRPPKSKGFLLFLFLAGSSLHATGTNFKSAA